VTSLDGDIIMPGPDMKLWEETYAGLRAFVAKRIAAEADVEDILQEVFLRVHRRIDCLQDSRKVVPWIYQITRNAIVDYYRSSQRRHEVPVGSTGEMEDVIPVSVTLSKEPARSGIELAACLRPMLSQLSAPYREAVTLTELEGLTQEAAARQLGLSVAGIKSRVQRGRKQLKLMLDDCCSIQMDQRRGVVGYEIREPGCSPCDESPPLTDH
jgi:RNA polymerase sigma-70 factor, ECF subfamily